MKLRFIIIVTMGTWIVHGVYLIKVSNVERQLKTAEKYLNFLKIEKRKKELEYEKMVDLEKIEKEMRNKNMKISEQIEFFRIH